MSRLALVRKALPFSIAVGATLIALVAAAISFTGRQELAAVRAELRAKKEPLRLVDLAPPPVAGAENFFRSPFWEQAAKTGSTVLDNPPESEEVADLQRIFPRFAGQDFSRRRDLVAADILSSADPAGDPDAAACALLLLEPLAPTLDEIERQLKRPAARAPIAYEQGLAAPLKHLDALAGLGRVLHLRARAELQLRDAPAAQTSVLALLRLANTVAAEPFMKSALTRAGLIQSALAVITEGITTHQWSDEALREFERALAPIDLIAPLPRVLRGERATFAQAVEAMPELFGTPGNTTFLAADLASALRERQRRIEAVEAAGRAGLPVELLSERQPESRRVLHLMNDLDGTALVVRHIARTQDRVSATRLACALERAFRRDGAYPESLDALVPAFLPALPRDVVSLRPFHYERPAPNAFRLWSEGWNRRNDGGTPPRADGRDGDWVWSMDSR